MSIFMLPPSIAKLAQQLKTHEQNSAKMIANQMAKSHDEISHWAEYNYMLVNDDLETCTERLFAIITAEHLQRERQPGLIAHVRGLNAKFEGIK